MPFRHRLAALAFAVLLGAALPALAQTAEEIRAVQAWLNAQGYDAGPADGMMGSRTRSAIGAWQADHGQPETGEVEGWLVELAMGEGDVPGAEALGLDAGAVTTSDPGSAVSNLEGDIEALAGTGALAFTEREDGAIVVTDGFPWRPGVAVPPRTIEIASAAYGLFTAAPDSQVPVPLDNNVVDVPGATFVPLFLALDREATARSSLADAEGIVWHFLVGDLRFELDGYVLVAARPGATIAFETGGVVLTGFRLIPQ